MESLSGGINYCIKKIYELNPQATIYFFTSGKAFNDKGGYDPFYEGAWLNMLKCKKRSVNSMAYHISISLPYVVIISIIKICIIMILFT